MKKQPLVSIIMPTYNCKRYIRDAIESMLHQTYSNFELIIVDDHSTDKTAKIIKKYAKRFSPFIRAVFFKKHLGDNATANRGFLYAKGQFIARMDADDIAHPERLEKQVAFLVEHPEIFVLGTQGYIIDATNTLIGEKRFPTTHRDIYKKFGIYNPMLHPSCMFRRSLLPNKKRLYEATNTIHDDYYTFFSYLRHGQFANLPEKLLYYRIHGKNYSLRNPKKRFVAIQKIRMKAIQTLSYKMSFSAKLTNIVQTFLVTILPEKAIVPLYMFLQGMYSPWQILKKRIRHFSPTTQVVISQEA